MGARVLAFVIMAASVACVVVAWMFWSQLTWPLRLLVAGIPCLFTFGLGEVRDLFMSYDRYRREWEAAKARERP